MSGRRTVALAVTLAALIGYWCLFESADPIDSSLREPLGRRAADRIENCDPTEIESIALQVGPRSISGLRSPTGWQTTALEDDDLWVNRAFDSIAGALCSLPVLDRVEAPEALGAFGLDAPRMVLEYVVGGRRRSLAIGSRNPVGNLVYARFEGAAAVLELGALFESELDKAARHARE